jgi:hypothetical protein
MGGGAGLSVLSIKDRRLRSSKPRRAILAAVALVVFMRCAALTGRNGLLPIRKGHSGQPTATHFRASVSLPPEQSMHLARIARVGLSGCPGSRSSRSSMVPGNLPTWWPPSALAGDGSR